MTGLGGLSRFDALKACQRSVLALGAALLTRVNGLGDLHVMQRDHPIGERMRIEGERCVYCGERATCWDHFPPYAVDQLRGWLLPACGECNGIAGDRHPYDFVARAAYVNRALIHRYRRVLNSTPWSRAELRELGRGLGDTIEPLAHARTIARERVRWDAIAYLATLGHGRRFQPIATKPDWQAPRVIELQRWSKPVVRPSSWKVWRSGRERWRTPLVIEVRWKPWARMHWRRHQWLDPAAYYPVDFERERARISGKHRKQRKSGRRARP